MAAGESRRDAKEATRLALVQSALELFIAQGFDGPSLDAICAHAGYTRGAFYVHFKDRDELIAAAMRYALDELLDQVIADDEDAEDIGRTVMRFIGIGLRPLPKEGDPPDGPFLHHVLEACRRSEEVRRMFVGVLGAAIRRVTVAVDAGQRSAILRGDITADDMATLLVALALGARVAVEVELPVDVNTKRDAALKLFFAPASD